MVHTHDSQLELEQDQTANQPATSRRPHQLESLNEIDETKFVMCVARYMQPMA